MEIAYGQGLLDWAGRCEKRGGFKPYAAANAAIFEKFGGRYLIRSGKIRSCGRH
jgi:uncharacterized protein (DUF1330 family)